MVLHKIYLGFELLKNIVQVTFNIPVITPSDISLIREHYMINQLLHKHVTCTACKVFFASTFGYSSEY